MERYYLSTPDYASNYIQVFYVNGITYPFSNPATGLANLFCQWSFIPKRQHKTLDVTLALFIKCKFAGKYIFHSHLRLM